MAQPITQHGNAYVESLAIIPFHAQDDELTSDKTETISSPTRWAKIRPKISGGYNYIDTTSFTNETTGDFAGLISDHTLFQVDMADAVFTMKVVEGLNKINYKFNFTDGEIEESYRYIDIHYSETSVEGTGDIKPKQEDCSPKP